MPKKVAERGPVSPTIASSRTTKTRAKRRVTFKASSWYESAMRTIAIKNEAPLAPRVQLWSARFEADAD
jgi:hypothetical protein